MTISRKVAALAVALIAMMSLNGRVLGQTQTPEVKKPQTAEETKKSQTSEVEQLKLRVQQLEDTLRELKGQISAIEETRTNPTPQTPQVVDALYTEPAAAAASAWCAGGCGTDRTVAVWLPVCGLRARGVSLYKFQFEMRAGFSAFVDLPCPSA